METMFRRLPDPAPLTREEVTHLIALPMRVDWKLDQIMEEMGIDHGEEED
jgi:hypothetical protein